MWLFSDIVHPTVLVRVFGDLFFDEFGHQLSESLLAYLLYLGFGDASISQIVADGLLPIIALVIGDLAYQLFLALRFYTEEIRH